MGLDAADEPAGAITLYRIFNLAYELHEARAVPGFEAFVRGLRSRSLTDATAEMWAVRHCARAGEVVEFVDPQSSAAAHPTLLSFSAVVAWRSKSKRAPSCP